MVNFDRITLLWRLEGIGQANRMGRRVTLRAEETDMTFK